jgi:hypothetical protein
VSRRLAPAVTLAVPIVLVALDVWLLASVPYLRWAYGRPHLAPPPGFTAAERLAVAEPSTLFIVRPMAPEALAALEHRGAPLYTEGEIAHLVDVKRLVGRLTGLALAGLAVIGLAAAAAARGGEVPTLARAVERGGWLAVGLIAAAAAAIGLAWPLFFTGFHELLFPPGTWQFAPDSALIRLFPERFWLDSAVVLAGLVALEGAAVALLARRLARR